MGEEDNGWAQKGQLFNSVTKCIPASIHCLLFFLKLVSICLLTISIAVFDNSVILTKKKFLSKIGKSNFN